MAKAQEALGGIRAAQGSYDAAARYFRKALALNPDLPAANFQLGVVLALQGNLAEAKIHLHETLDLRPEHAEAHLALGRLLVSEGRLNQAEDPLRRAAQAADPATRQQAAEALRDTNSETRGTR